MKIKLLSVGKAPKDIDAICGKKAKSAGIILDSVQDFSDKDKKSAIKRESDLILEKINRDDRVFLFDVVGDTSFSDIKLSENNVFIIGGSNGVDDRVREKAYRRISISALTFPHALFKLAAVELLAQKIK